MEEYNVVIVVVIVVVVIIHARHRHLYRIQSRDVSDRGIVLFLSVLSCLESGFSFVGMSVSYWRVYKVVRYLPQKVVCLMKL